MKTLLILFLFAASLTFNIALLASQTVFEIASSTFPALTDMPTGASKIHPKNLLKSISRGKRSQLRKRWDQLLMVLNAERLRLPQNL